MVDMDLVLKRFVDDVMQNWDNNITVIESFNMVKRSMIIDDDMAVAAKNNILLVRKYLDKLWPILVYLVDQDKCNYTDEKFIDNSIIKLAEVLLFDNFIIDAGKLIIVSTYLSVIENRIIKKINLKYFNNSDISKSKVMYSEFIVRSITYIKNDKHN